MIFDEDVNGIIIGQVSSPYEFWTSNNSGYPLYLEPHKIGNGWFSSDSEAIEYAKKYYPDDFRRGLELRCFDG